MRPLHIVGIALIKNEDIYIEKAIKNVLDFCDEFIAVDNCSRDGTVEIIKKIACDSAGKMVVHRVDHPKISHDLISKYAGTNTWVFAVDGDEVYDPSGLRKMRALLESGEFDKDWCVFGNVLNVKYLSLCDRTADGHLAPPCRSMTKLYNFSAIDAWEGPCQERLHGGNVIFRNGFHAGMRRDLHQAFSWDDSPFRCLHLCFLKRSSLDQKETIRPNIMDRHAWSFEKLLSKMSFLLRGQKPPNWKQEKYARGPIVKKDVSAFFEM